MPWGMADEAGFAARWLQANNAPGLAALAGYLGWRDGMIETDHGLCPLCLGTTIMDAQRDVPNHLGRVKQPLLLAPYLAGTAPSGLSLKWNGTAMIVSKHGLATTATREALLIAETNCETSRATSQIGLTTMRVPDSEADAIALLNHFARRTYAPATEASRLSGAGAGTTDND